MLLKALVVIMQIVRRYTRLVRDVGIQVTPPQATRSIQTSCNTVPPPPPGPEHDYLGFSTEIADSENELLKRF